MRLRSLAAGLSFAAMLLAVAPAHAEDKDKSRVAFKKGVAAAQSGDYATARVAFAEAYSFYARPTILLNLAIAEWKDGKYIDAEGHLTKYLADAGEKSDDDVESAKAAMRDVKAHVGVIRITILTNGGKAFLDEQPLSLVVGQSTDVRANVGEHTLRVEADGSAPFRKDVRLTAADPDVENVTLVPWNGSGTPPTATTTTATPATTDASATGDDGGWNRHKTGWVLLGAGAALAIGGAVCGFEAISKSSAYTTDSEKPDASAPNSLASADKSNGIAFRTTADILFLGAIAGGAFGAYFLLTDSPSDSATAASKPSASIGVVPGGMALRGTF